MDITLLGAGGALGRLVRTGLETRGHRVVAVPRHETRNPDAIARANAPLIINCAGASVMMGLGKGWRGYRAVDVPIGVATVEAAKRTNARLVYVAAHHVPALRRTPYIDAHERVVAAMREVDGHVVRATGFFAVFASLLPLAKRGLLVDVGNGSARTNPIDERDLAQIVVEVALGSGGPRELSAGGPEILRRREIFEQVAAIAHRRVRMARVPTWVARLGLAMLAPLHPRISQFGRFACGLAVHDGIAPALGTRRLADYLATVDE